MHGGKSTGPKTAEGIERIRASRTIHCRYSQESIAGRREARALIRFIRALLRSEATTELEVQSALDALTSGELSNGV
jgi:hypothetical protein